MPLKHPVETLLVFLLALAIALTGLVIAVLPPLPEGAFPWGVAFLLSNLYPLALYPLFKKRRADYEFRALHFLPALLLLFWLIVELLIQYTPSAIAVQRWYTYGWALPGVVLSLVLLFWYSMHVLRQRRQRMVLLTGVLVAFLALGVGAQQWTAGQKMTAAVRGVVWRLAGTEFDGPNLGGSAYLSEEVWRMRMRRQERRDARIARNNAEPGASIASVSPTSAQSSVLIAVNHSSMTMSVAAGSTSSAAPPPKLSHTGPMTEAFGLFFVAGYCAVMQKRARKRLVA